MPIGSGLHKIDVALGELRWHREQEFSVGLSHTLEAELVAPPPPEAEVRPAKRFVAVVGLGGIIDIVGKNYPPSQASLLFGFEYRIATYPAQAFITIILMDIWHWTPFVTLTLLAGLLAVPKEPVEQAQVDGANRWQVFQYVTIPMMMPVLLTVVFIRLMDALRVVDEVFMLTGGGPGTATQLVGIYIWRVVFPKTDYGYGSAMSLVVLYFTIVLSWLLYIALSRIGKRE